MNTSKPLQIFKPGTHTAMSGASLAFSESDIAAMVAAYDPAKHEAPLVVGHPKHDKPRFGGVGSLAYADGFVNARTKDVLPEFSEWVGKKMFTSVSSSFYAPDAPGNPVPGVYYLRHVGFLGAQPPAVKGLNQHGISFSDAEEGIVEFSEWDDVTNASLWRKLREWVIGKFGQEEADQVISSWDVQSLEQGAQDELREAQQERAAQAEQNTVAGVTASFTEGGDEMSAEDKARLAVLEAENTQLKAQQLEFAEAEKKRRADARHAEHVAFAEGLIKEGKLLPVHKAVTVATLDNLAGQDTPVEFGEGDAKQPLAEAYKAQLKAAPKLVEFSEVAGADSNTSKTVDFAAPAGFTVDADLLETHQKALAYQAANKTTYESALAAVSA